MAKKEVKKTNNKEVKKVTKNNETKKATANKDSKNKKSFFKSFKVELKKVIWPTPKQLLNNTVTVIVIVLICTAIVFVLDLTFEAMNKNGIEKIKEVVTTNSTQENTNTENQTDTNTTVEGQTDENQTAVESNETQESQTTAENTTAQ